MNSTETEPPHIIRRWTLELNGLASLNPKFVQRDDMFVRRAELTWPAFNRFLHETVGMEFHWSSRDQWTEQNWAEYVDRPELETWVLYVRGTPAGYFETEYFPDSSARIHTFGLRRPFFGQGLGAHLLSFAAGRAFERGARRVWLRTCTKDHPHALPNYQARGFQVIREEELPARVQRT